jgi:glycosyltransferase involved in cell wall biosynthesis
MKPLVSILIPAFNAQRSLSDTIRSALAQTWPNKEVIIVDDSSQDQTLSVARRFESKGVIVITQANQGAAATRNKAFSLSKGDYIQWLDADDLLSPDKIAEQVKELNHCQGRRTLLSSAWGYFFYRWDKADFKQSALWCDLSPIEWLLRKMEQNLYMQTATWLVSRELTEAAGPWNTQLLSDDDGEYFARVVLASDGIKFAPKGKVYYRRSGYNRLSYIGQSNKKLEAQFHSMKLNIGYVRSLQDSDRVRAACLKYLQTWLIYFYPNRPDIVQQAKSLARELGGHLEIPRFSWKYSWLQSIFGFRAAKRAQHLLPKIKECAISSYDQILFRLCSN